MIPQRVVQQYQQYCLETNFMPFSTSTMLRILSSCSASVRKSLQGLDYITAKGTKAIDDLISICETLLGEHGQDKVWVERCEQALKEGKQYLKTDYKSFELVFIRAKSTTKLPANKSASDQHALQPEESETDFQENGLFTYPFHGCVCTFQRHYNLEQHMSYGKCKIIEEKHNLLDKAKILYREKLLEGSSAQPFIAGPESPLPAISEELPQGWALKSAKKGGRFNNNQRQYLDDKFRIGEITGHKFDPAQVAQDMRYAKHNDGSRRFTVEEFLTPQQIKSYFSRTAGKLRKSGGTEESDAQAIEDQAIYSSTRDLIIQECHIAHPITYDVYNICEMSATNRLKKLSIAMLRTICSYYNINIEDVPETRKAPYIKLISQLLRVQTTVLTMIFRFIFPGVQQFLITAGVKWEGISYLNNIEYSKEGVRVWRAYSVGPGKFSPWSEFNLPDNYVLPKLNTAMDARVSKVSFTDVTARRRSSRSNSHDEQTAITPEDNTSSTDDDTEEQSLFFCTEEGCIKSFQRYSSLQNHLDCGIHKYVLERETLFDKAIIAYAAKLEQGAIADVPEISEDIPPMMVDEPALKMGWALKSIKQQRKRLSEKQKKYLHEVYQIGEQTGHKADPAAVSRSMRRAKLSSGEPMFDATEFLTPQQITNYFSRLTAKKAIPENQAEDRVENQKDFQEVDTEKQIQDLNREVLDAVSICHPVMYDTYNICEYASHKKLDRFSILVLQEVCTSLQLDIHNIKGKRKKPYIDIIVSLVEKCTCKCK
ncbi:hypothetical protein QZH41_001341 [Actinostola sp. cb2023]|nr:hypothetical protein QZH41_001341 [Actinostola sp. cb2023]